MRTLFTILRRTEPPQGSEPEVETDALHVLSRKGMWGILFFLLGSLAAYAVRSETLTACISTGLRDGLGLAPPVVLIDAILAISTLSSFVVIAGRIGNGSSPGGTWGLLGFRLFFYLLYFMADYLPGRFSVVFSSGLLVLALQHYHVWTHTWKKLEERMTTGHPYGRGG